jgi:hypothetical protein
MTGCRADSQSGLVLWKHRQTCKEHADAAQGHDRRFQSEPVCRSAQMGEQRLVSEMNTVKLPIASAHGTRGGVRKSAKYPHCFRKNLLQSVRL